MTITGNIQHAAVILNKLRTKPFYESKPGEVIWRQAEREARGKDRAGLPRRCAPRNDERRGERV